VTPAAASPARAPRPASAPSVAAPPAAAAAPAHAARSENPTVFLRCEGFAAICNALRASLLEQFQKHNILPVREPNRAAIVLTGNVEVVQERVSREFGQAMQTRTYTVDVSGETRDGSPVSMPPPRTFSFDAQFGRERLDENARLIASDVTDKIRAFWNK
jgi:rRNA maturation protein Nop10